jgi:hypothetical protein
MAGRCDSGRPSVWSRYLSLLTMQASCFKAYLNGGWERTSDVRR